MNHTLAILSLASVCFFYNINPVNTVNNKPIPGAEKAIKTGRIKGPAGYLYYDDGGQGGIPVVFVHSFGGSTDHWQSQLDYLRKTRRAIAFDLRGHGRSDSPATLDYAITSLANDIAAVVDGLGLKRFVLVGHSIGGAASIAYAGKHPDRVAGLVVSGAPGKSTEEQSQQIIASLEAETYQKVMDDYMNQLLAGALPATDSIERAGMIGLSKRTSIAIIKSAFQFDPLPSLKNYAGPKLIISNTQEQQPNSLHAQTPEIPFKAIEGASHWTQLDKPDEFNRILTDFLGIVDPKN